MAPGTERRAIVWALLAVAACAPATGYRRPSSITAYHLVVPGSDSLADGLAAGLSAEGFRVRRTVWGGDTPVLTVLVFRFRDLVDVHAVDTRTGRRIAAVRMPRHALSGAATDAGRVLGSQLADALRRVRRTPTASRRFVPSLTVSPRTLHFTAALSTQSIRVLVAPVIHHSTISYRHGGSRWLRAPSPKSRSSR